MHMHTHAHTLIRTRTRTRTHIVGHASARAHVKEVRAVRVQHSNC